MQEKSVVVSMLHAFVVGGVYMIIDEDESCRFVIKFIVCWLSVIFWGGGGLFLGVTTLYNTIKRIPYLIIYDDRVEHYVQFKQGIIQYILQM